MYNDLNSDGKVSDICVFLKFGHTKIKSMLKAVMNTSLIFLIEKK